MSLLEQEYLKVLMLDWRMAGPSARTHLFEIVELYHGSLNDGKKHRSAQVLVGEVFKPTVQRMAHAIIGGKEHRAHNHSSGDPSPSPDDIALTRAIAQAGKLMDIDLLDHLVIGRTPTGYLPLKERGLGFS